MNNLCSINSKILLSIIIPSYLEEENLRLLIPRLCNVLSKINGLHEVLVVDTMESLDLTREICSAHSIRYINRNGGNDYGDAIRTGIKESNGQLILFMDADGSHSPEFIPNMLNFMHSYDIVIASRYIQNGASENNLVLILMSRVLNFTYSFLLKLPCKDVSNSFKLFRSNHLKNINLVSDNFDIVEEIIYKVYKSNINIRIKEVPFFFKKRMFGKTKRNLFIFIITYIYTIFMLRFFK